MSGERLTRLEVACLALLRSRGLQADPKRSHSRGKLLTLCDAQGRVLCEIIDGVQVEESDAGLSGIGWARIRPFLLRVYCHRCDRSVVRQSDQWLPGETWDCPRCAGKNILPRDVLAASRED